MSNAEAARYLKLLAAILYEQDGRIEIRESSVDAIPEEFELSKTYIDEMGIIILKLEDNNEGN